MRGWLAVALLVVVLLPGVAAAQVYRWVDEQGTVHYATGLESVPEQYRAGAQELAAPSPVEPTPGPPPAGATSISFTPGSPILVSARINGAGPITLILDTGADRTMVAPGALSRLGILAASAARLEIRGVTGAVQADLVWVNSVEVGSAAVGPLPIIAHDASLKAADGLLGRDFLSLFTVTIDTQSGVVTLTRN